MTTDRRFVDAQDLHVGERVQRLDGSLGVMMAVVVTPGAAVRYNLTVHEWHTFAVGADQWVVHNCDLGLGDSANSTIDHNHIINRHGNDQYLKMLRTRTLTKKTYFKGFTDDEVKDMVSQAWSRRQAVGDLLPDGKQM